MKGKKEDDVTVEQMRFGNRSTAKKEAKKRGRPLKYPGDKKEKKTLSIRGSFLQKKPKGMTYTQFFEACVTSSM